MQLDGCACCHLFSIKLDTLGKTCHRIKCSCAEFFCPLPPEYQTTQGKSAAQDEVQGPGDDAENLDAEEAAAILSNLQPGALHIHEPLPLLKKDLQAPDPQPMNIVAIFERQNWLDASVQENVTLLQALNAISDPGYTNLPDLIRVHEVMTSIGHNGCTAVGQ